MARNWNPCAGVGKPVARGEYERTTGLATAGAWATTRCPDCGRKVGAGRPTKAHPNVTVNMHHVTKKAAAVAVQTEHDPHVCGQCAEDSFR